MTVPRKTAEHRSALQEGIRVACGEVCSASRCDAEEFGERDAYSVARNGVAR